MGTRKPAAKIVAFAVIFFESKQVVYYVYRMWTFLLGMTISQLLKHKPFAPKCGIARRRNPIDG